MRADKMVVHYRKNDTGQAKTTEALAALGTATDVAAAAFDRLSRAATGGCGGTGEGAGAQAESIYRIESMAT
ncbi:MAG: hypothetical protein WDN72_09705 [Alphaproteobacteria bacterium]